VVVCGSAAYKARRHQMLRRYCVGAQIRANMADRISRHVVTSALICLEKMAPDVTLKTTGAIFWVVNRICGGSFVIVNFARRRRIAKRTEHAHWIWIKNKAPSVSSKPAVGIILFICVLNLFFGPKCWQKGAK